MKKFATLLPNNWLPETPQMLVLWQTVGGKIMLELFLETLQDKSLFLKFVYSLAEDT
ncbi:hypothetical protein ACIQYG_18970 [Peribacillus sp. NPDC096622]|uniref:hypothetical protein n=1 Tax=Peribacillus sp. NPDC096622 TaxID=3364396 RepID=UPI0038020159